ncbi:endolytic transglycosylase MltG [Pseudomonas sp. NW5]|uniref:endolytic transglycosylase MltG n=1 Tax=Pseudomonas sp. NW5 TaxID=2934934 RepID=UPI002020D65D|nr:endolytic transglycosylase MltG [Pseudomonas sp. NW5]
MKRILIALLLGTVLSTGLALLLASWRLQVALEQPLVLEQERLLEVPAGAAPGRLLNTLEEQGVLDQALWLRLYWRFALDSPALHTGEYRLSPGLRATDLLSLWQRGEVVQYSLTLIEGWNFRQLRAALEAEPRLEQTLSGLDDAALMARLGLEGEHPEGRFFPDTYRFAPGMRDIDLLQLARERLDQVLEDEWAQRVEGLPYRTPYEALIMASLIEKETGVAYERAQIAGVFLRRLRLGMLLQTDPAVIYGMGERFQGKLTRADLRTPTPYNTYTNPGLPPTPIALVGREAIHAALNPADGDTLYFVARGDGSHVFSRTLDEHNRAVRAYQLKRRADYRSSPPPSVQEAAR